MHRRNSIGDQTPRAGRRWSPPMPGVAIALAGILPGAPDFVQRAVCSWYRNSAVRAQPRVHGAVCISKAPYRSLRCYRTGTSRPSFKCRCIAGYWQQIGVVATARCRGLRGSACPVWQFHWRSRTGEEDGTSCGTIPGIISYMAISISPCRHVVAIFFHLKSPMNVSNCRF